MRTWKRPSENSATRIFPRWMTCWVDRVSRNGSRLTPREVVVAEIRATLGEARTAIRDGLWDRRTAGGVERRHK